MLTILFKILTKKCVLCRSVIIHTHILPAVLGSASYIFSFLARLPPDNQNYCSFSVSAARRFSRYGSKLFKYLSYIIRISLDQSSSTHTLVSFLRPCLKSWLDYSSFSMVNIVKNKAIYTSPIFCSVC